MINVPGCHDVLMPFSVSTDLQTYLLIDLWELQRSYVEEHRERAECQGVVTKGGGKARLRRQYEKRRKPGKKLRRPRREEISQMQG